MALEKAFGIALLRQGNSLILLVANNFHIQDPASLTQVCGREYGSELVFKGDNGGDQFAK
jgi:hypothetical protein